MTLAEYGSKDSLFSSKNSYSCIVDSGTTLIIMPPNDFTILYKMLQDELGSDAVVCAFGVCMVYKSCASISSKLEPLYFGFDNDL